MSKLLKETCPNCRAVVKGWHRTSSMAVMGVPVQRCPKCGMLLITEEHREYIMLGAWDYFKYAASTILSSAFLGFLLGGILQELLKSVAHIENPPIWIHVLTGIVIFILLVALDIRWWYQDKRESIKRTKDPRYLNMLMEAKLITQEDYDRAVELGKRY